MKIACGVEYDGSGFCGWQTQTGVRTVQAQVEAAFSTVADQAVHVQCAGRTDTGVHATGQVVHFETTAVRPARSWTLGANANLPADVSVQWVVTVPESFHARFSATARSYRYVVCNRPTRPAVLAGKVTWDYRAIDEQRMASAARHLVGAHDFSAFRAAGCQARNPIRIVRFVEISRCGEFVLFDVEANAFLHHMVRNIAGVLLAIGAGEREPDWAREVLAGRDRTLGGVTAPPEGLYLTGVRYPREYQLPKDRPGWPATCADSLRAYPSSLSGLG